jgi:type II secretory pathway component PulJ
MTEQQQHLQQMVSQQNDLIQQIQTLNNDITLKRELAMKLQGAIEYLQQTGVTLPEPETEAPAQE